MVSACVGCGAVAADVSLSVRGGTHTHLIERLPAFRRRWRWAEEEHLLLWRQAQVEAEDLLSVCPSAVVHLEAAFLRENALGRHGLCIGTAKRTAGAERSCATMQEEKRKGGERGGGAHP